MLRTAFSRRWIASLVAVLLVVVGMLWLGFWQWRIAEEHGRAEALRAGLERPVLELVDYLAPHTAFPRDGSNQRLRAHGHYEPARRVFVVDRRLDGVAGYWVVEPFVVAATGARLPVVRGFVTRHAGMPPAPPPDPAGGPAPGGSAAGGGSVVLVGSLAPSESPQPARGPLGPGETTAVSAGALLNEWGGEIYNAFVFAVSETPDTAAEDLPGMLRVPPPDVPGGLTLRNAAYAVQWWIFAAFVVWMWGKMVRDDYRRAQQSEHVSPPAGAPQ